MSTPFTTSTLDNGLRIVVEHMPGVKTVAAGFLARTGSRDETPELAGVSHFLEHMCFKGTPKRTAAQINLDFDNLGAHPNAFTSQDKTFYHALTRAEDIEPQIEILADMMHSTLPQEEFDTEKQTVLNEIAMSQDQLEHIAFDVILEGVFQKQSLGWPVLGYENTISPMSRDAMADYMKQRYAPDNMILVVAGNVDAGEVQALAQKYCGDWKASGYQRTRTEPAFHTGNFSRVVERFNQQLVALCYPAPTAVDDLHYSAGAAATILGGPNSRIFWNVVQTGICPRAEAFRLDYDDTAMLILYGVTEPDNAEKLTDALKAEAAKMTKEPVEAHEVQRVRNKQRTSLAVESEATHHRLVQVMEDMDYRNRPRTVEERLDAVEAISAESISACFSRYPADGEACLITVGPRDWLK